MSVYKILEISLGSAKHKQISIETSNPQLHKKQAQIRGKTARLATLLSSLRWLSQMSLSSYKIQTPVVRESKFWLVLNVNMKVDNLEGSLSYTSNKNSFC